jgi:hypothetical protein
MKMYVTQWTCKPGEEKPVYLIQFQAAMTAAQFITIFDADKITPVKTLFDFDSHGQPILREFPKMPFFKDSLKRMLYGGNDKGVIVSIQDMLWKSLRVEPFNTDDNTVLVTLTGNPRTYDDKALERLLTACQVEAALDYEWQSLQSDITDGLDGDGLLYMLRTGKQPKAEAKAQPGPEPDTTILEKLAEEINTDANMEAKVVSSLRFN